MTIQRQTVQPTQTQSPSKGGLLQRACACGQHSGSGGECEECRKKREGTIQRAAVSSSPVPAVPPIVHEVLRAPGQPLDAATRAFMEPRLAHNLSQVRVSHVAAVAMPSQLSIGRPGDRFEHEADTVASGIGQGPTPTPAHRYDLSGVRVHTDARAAESAQAVQARAYTVGRDVVFGAGQYAPATHAGQQLIAHELTHVLQQAKAPSLQPALLQRQPETNPAPADGGLSAEMLQQIARRLRKAMAGWGTDEDAIYSALSGRTQPQVDAIARVYQEMYGRALLADLQDELNESEMRHLATLSPLAVSPGSAGAKADPGAALADRVAMQLNEAMDRWGTDEESIYAALSGRTPDERQAIKTAYKNLTKRELEADLRDELSGSELRHALMLLNQGLLQPEDELYLAMAGLGTDEATIFRVLEGMAGNTADITAMEQRYRQKYGDLVADLRGDLSGGDYARAMQVLGPVIQDVAFNDCPANTIPDTRRSIATAIEKVRHTIAILGKGWDGMSAAEKAIFNQYFDPSGSGSIDKEFVRQVRANFSLILHDLRDDLVIECETDCGASTQGYYIALGTIHVCQRFHTDPEKERVATIIHEMGHGALQAIDRPYWNPDPNSDYAKMTPRGSLANQIPVIGPLIRFIAHRDTLYALDAYAYCAYDMP